MYQTRIDNKQNMCSKGIRFILSNLSVFFSASQVSASHRHHPPSLIISHYHQHSATQWKVAALAPTCCHHVQVVIAFTITLINCRHWFRWKMVERCSFRLTPFIISIRIPKRDKGDDDFPIAFYTKNVVSCFWGHLFDNKLWECFYRRRRATCLLQNPCQFFKRFDSRLAAWAVTCTQKCDALFMTPKQ